MSIVSDFAFEVMVDPTTTGPARSGRWSLIRRTAQVEDLAVITASGRARIRRTPQVDEVSSPTVPAVPPRRRAAVAAGRSCHPAGAVHGLENDAPPLPSAASTTKVDRYVERTRRRHRGDPPPADHGRPRDGVVTPTGPRSVPVRQRSPSTAEQRRIKRLWVRHSIAEDRRDIDGLIATLAPSASTRSSGPGCAGRVTTAPGPSTRSCSRPSRTTGSRSPTS